MSTIFGKNLIRLRRARGLSQEQLAKMAGLSKRQIGYYEKELNDSILANIELIAKTLNVKLSEFFQDENNNAEAINEFPLIDSRTTEKIKKLLELPRDERHMIYNIIDAFVFRHRREKKGKQI